MARLAGREIGMRHKRFCISKSAHCASSTSRLRAAVMISIGTMNLSIGASLSCIAAYKRSASSLDKQRSFWLFSSSKGNLSAEQQALLASIPDPMFRQTTRDFCVNQQFRKDYWVKGARKLSALEQAEALRALRVVLVQPRADVSLKVTGSLGEATLQEAVYGPSSTSWPTTSPSRSATWRKRYSLATLASGRSKKP